MYSIGRPPLQRFHESLQALPRRSLGKHVCGVVLDRPVRNSMSDGDSSEVREQEEEEEGGGQRVHREALPNTPNGMRN